MRFRVLAIAALVALAGCHPRAHPPTEAPEVSSTVAGDGVAVLTWNDDSSLTYWIFFQAGDSVVAASPSATAIRSVVSPRVVTGLVNGTQYAFVMNATREDSPAGPSSPVFTATPRLAGANWVSGAPLGSPPQNLNAIAFSGTRFVVAGNATTIFAGDYNYANTNPVGVTMWLPPVLPAGFASDLSAVLFNGSFVAMGRDGSILTSADGVTWTLAASPVPGPGMNGLAFGASNYVAVGDGGKIFRSTDLINWFAATNNAGTTNDLYSVSFLNGKFIATGALGTLLTSADGGDNWTALASSTTNALRAAAFGLTSQSVARYVVVGDGGTILTSPGTDGVLWTPVTPAPFAGNLNGVTVGSRFLAVGQGGAVAYSDDGTTWSTASAGSADLSGVLFAPGTYVAVGASGANVFAQ